jgi:hypothetical protein
MTSLINLTEAQARKRKYLPTFNKYEDSSIIHKIAEYNLGLENDIKEKKSLFDTVEEALVTRLQPHQRNLVNYTKFTHAFTRGTYILHSMGSGKTRACIHVVDTYLDKYPNHQVVFCSSKSIKGNFKSAVKEEEPYLKHLKLENIKFVTSNSENFSLELFKSSPLFTTNEFISKEHVDSITESDFLPEMLENMIIIFDEAHNFFASVSSGSRVMKGDSIDSYKKSEIVYKRLLNTKTSKFICMTGTAIVNHIYDFAVGINLISRNKVFYDDIKLFSDLFIYGNSMINKFTFIKKIMGCVSYYGEDYYSDEIKNRFPSSKRKKINIEMSTAQMIAYLIEDYRLFQKGDGVKVGNRLQQTEFEFMRSKMSADVNYKMSLRVISNSSISKDELTNIDIESVFKNLKSISPKIYHIVNHIVGTISKNRDHRSLVYTYFTTGVLNVVKKILDHIGVRNVIISSNTTEEERSDIVRQFNRQNRLNLTDEEKKSGDYDYYIKNIEPNLQKETIDVVNVFLISSSAAEGLDLKNIETVHIMEPNWTNTKIAQAERRAIRLNSHLGLKKNQRHVDIYHYTSVFKKPAPKQSIHDFIRSLDIKKIPTDYIERKIMEDGTIDMMISIVSDRKSKLYDELIDVIKYGAVDCLAYNPYTKCLKLENTRKLINKNLGLPMDIDEDFEELNIKWYSEIFVFTSNNIKYYYYVIRFKKNDGTDGINYEPMYKVNLDTKETTIAMDLNTINSMKYELGNRNDDDVSYVLEIPKDRLVIHKFEFANPANVVQDVDSIVTDVIENYSPQNCDKDKVSNLEQDKLSDGRKTMIESVIEYFEKETYNSDEIGGYSADDFADVLPEY